MGHFVSSPREMEKSDRRDSTEDERGAGVGGGGGAGPGRKMNRNEREVTEEIKKFSRYPYLP